jgi:outer membrane protein TolC
MLMSELKRKYLVTLLAATVITLLLPLAVHAQNKIWAPPHLQSLIQEGLTNNQSIKSMQSAIDALDEQVSLAGALPDPRLGVALLNLPVDSFRFDEEPMTQKQVFLAQKLPWYGKRGLKEEQALFAVKQKKMELSAKKLALSRKIASTYYELAFIIQSQNVNQQLTDIIKQILRSTESRYAAGKGLQQDIFQAQVELSKLKEEATNLRKKRRVTEDHLNNLLGREFYQPIIPSPTPSPEFSLPYFSFSVQDLKDIASKNNPQLKAMQYEILTAKTGIDLARKDYWPDMDFKIAYGQREESKAGNDWPDFFSTGVTLNIPLWYKTKQDKKVAATSASHRSKSLAYQNFSESLHFQIDAAATEIMDLQDNLLLFNDSLLPQSKNWAKASMREYEVGQIEFNAMIKSQTQLFKFELQAKRYLFSIYQKRAELEEMLGQPIPEQTKLTQWQSNGTGFKQVIR